MISFWQVVIAAIVLALIGWLLAEFLYYRPRRSEARGQGSRGSAGAADGSGVRITVIPSSHKTMIIRREERTAFINTQPNEGGGAAARHREERGQ